MPVRRSFAVFAACSTLLLVAGCSRRDATPVASELDDPDYRHAQQLQRQGRNNEALNAYLKTISARGYDNAPESHLSAGEIYLLHVKDPLQAIHHYKRFLDARPNSPQAPNVKERIATATREFARTLPARPMEDVSMRVESAEELDRLRRENNELRAENATLRGGTVGTPSRSSTRFITGPLASAGNSTGTTPAPAPAPEQEARNPFIVAPLPTPAAPAEQPRDTRPAVSQNTGTGSGRFTPAPQPSSTSRTTATTPARPATGGQTHTVRPQETMYAISKRFGVTVNELARYNGISNPASVPVGTVLRIPPPSSR